MIDAQQRQRVLSTGPIEKPAQKRLECHEGTVRSANLLLGFSVQCILGIFTYSPLGRQ